MTWGAVPAKSHQLSWGAIKQTNCKWPNSLPASPPVIDRGLNNSSHHADIAGARPALIHGGNVLDFLSEF
jgi:hypothetical protein